MINNETRGKKEEQGRKRRMGLEEEEWAPPTLSRACWTKRILDSPTCPRVARAEWRGRPTSLPAAGTPPPFPTSASLESWAGSLANGEESGDGVSSFSLSYALQT
jgi:hypothetical protein